MKNMIFLFNPRSGREQIRSQLMGILDYFCSQGYFPSVYVTQNSQDAERIAREYGSSADLFLCSGGDGTLNNVAIFPPAPPTIMPGAWRSPEIPERPRRLP